MTSTSDISPVVQMTSISKRFPGVQALDTVNFTLEPGEVLGLAGENGSGKSTLMKVLAGKYAPDSGAIELNGAPARWKSPAAALNAGVALIAQEVLVHPDLTVAENLFFGEMPRRRGLISWGTVLRQAADLLGELGVEVAPDRRMGGLALHQQQLISIVKMARRDPRVLILDEPTSSLTAQEVEIFKGVVEGVRARGASVVYITHRLREYFELCHRVVVLRDGQLVGERQIAELTEADLVRLMVGRELSSIFERPAGRDTQTPARETPVLTVRNLSTAHKLRDVNLVVNPGEVVGIAGQAGAGRSSLARTLFGLTPYDGQIELSGRAVRLKSARDAIGAGIAYVPEDRKQQGLVLGRSVHENLTMPSWRRTSRWGLRSTNLDEEIAVDAVRRLQIRAPSGDTPVAALSGGNQQKVVLGKWLACAPRLLLLDEPTRGVDVGAKDEIYRIIDRASLDGMAVVVCSSELLELLRLADRILVMARGRVVGEQLAATATEESIADMAFAGLDEKEPTT